MKLRVGQILYLVPWGNFARGKKDVIYTVKVESIGRKYGTLTCDEFNFTSEVNNQFDLETLENNNGNYSPQYILYTDFDDINNRPNLLEKLRKSIGGLTYSQLQSIEKDIQFLKSTL